mmetsp:Transcript_29596/g.67877  ORF Transcript_29596/g.67877 Transcript_29596/m.67877 type:complete len:258 (+) Transcript_29596:2205-2978(+)
MHRLLRALLDAAGRRGPRGDDHQPQGAQCCCARHARDDATSGLHGARPARLVGVEALPRRARPHDRPAAAHVRDRYRHGLRAGRSGQIATRERARDAIGSGNAPAPRQPLRRRGQPLAAQLAHDRGAHLPRGYRRGPAPGAPQEPQPEERAQSARRTRPQELESRSCILAPQNNARFLRKFDAHQAGPKCARLADDVGQGPSLRTRHFALLALTRTCPPRHRHRLKNVNTQDVCACPSSTRTPALQGGLLHFYKISW